MGHARRGGAGSSSTAQHDGDCHAERGSKTGNAHSDLLSQQTPEASARMGHGNRLPQRCPARRATPAKTLNVVG